MRAARTLTVAMLSPASRRGTLRMGELIFPCALGRGGVRALKREGDGATPRGAWRITETWYRADRVPRPATALPVRRIGRCDGWCDAPADRNYNRRVALPYAASAEAMWRDDGLYDLGAVLAYNARPRVRGLGSAIFIHVARPGLAPTEGCLALDRRHLARILARLRPGASVRILR